MSSDKKKLLKSLLTVNAGCGGCSRPKLSDAYQPKPKPKPKSCSKPPNPKNNVLISTVENYDDLTSTSLSFNNMDTISSSTESELPDLPKVKLGHHCSKVVNSIAVVKDSNDPYQDFRHSMLQMIVEKGIYSKHDLDELLQCFLELNSRCHHHVILKAFTEIRNQVMSNEIVTVRDRDEPCLVHVRNLDDDPSLRDQLSVRVGMTIPVNTFNSHVGRSCYLLRILTKSGARSA